jgi:hypothetical protein
MTPVRSTSRCLLQNTLPAQQQCSVTALQQSILRSPRRIYNAAAASLVHEFQVNKKKGGICM